MKLKLDFLTKLENIYWQHRLYTSIEDLPINIEDIKKFAHNPQIHIKNIRKICRWAYYENGSVMTSIYYLKTMFTLDKVVYSK